MPLTVAKVRCLEQIFSPYSGLPADGEDGPNESDSTLLFIYSAEVGEYSHVSDLLRGTVDGDVEDLEIEELCERLSGSGMLVLEVDADWNGVNFYGFAPKETAADGVRKSQLS